MLSAPQLSLSMCTGPNLHQESEIPTDGAPIPKPAELRKPTTHGEWASSETRPKGNQLFCSETRARAGGHRTWPAPRPLLCRLQQLCISQPRALSQVQAVHAGIAGKTHLPFQLHRSLEYCALAPPSSSSSSSSRGGGGGGSSGGGPGPEPGDRGHCCPARLRDAHAAPRMLWLGLSPARAGTHLVDSRASPAGGVVLRAG